MEELYKPEGYCAKCGSTMIEYYPDGGYHCNACGFSNMPERNL